MSNKESNKKKFTIFEEDEDDDEENILKEEQKNISKKEQNSFTSHENNKNVTTDPDYQELLPTINLGTEENIALLLSFSKAIIVISIIMCIFLFFVLANNRNTTGISFLIYLIASGITIFGSYISATLLKTQAFKLHNLYTLNKKLDKIINEKKK